MDQQQPPVTPSHVPVPTTPGASPAAPPPPAPPAAQELHQRIALLRDKASRLGQQGRVLTQTAAIITLISSGLGALGSLLSFLVVGSAPLGFASISGSADLFMLVASAVNLALASAAAFYSIHVLINVNNLYHRTYGEVRYKLYTAGLGLLIADESYWQRIHDGLNQATVLKMIGKSTYNRFEDHLTFCACHIESLEALDWGADVSIWKLRHEEMAFRNKKLFQQQTWIYWLGGCLTFLLARALFIFALLFTIWGSRYVSSQASLVAICEFLMVDAPLQQPAHLPNAKTTDST